MKKLNLMVAAATAVVALGMAGSAGAVDYAYMTGSTLPWDQSTNEDAMNAAFGSGAWNGFHGFDNSVFTAGYAFIYLDGSDQTTGEINTFLGANLSNLETFVSSGGRVLLNIARNTDFGTTLTGFGTSIAGDSSYNLASSSADLTTDGVAAGLDLNGAGTSFGGGYFSHDVVSGVDVCYISGSAGCVFGAVTEGLFVGGQTTTNFHSGSDPFQLRVNELNLAATGAVNVGGAVPEPATWALMIGGFGLAGAALRRRRVVAA